MFNLNNVYIKKSSPFIGLFLLYAFLAPLGNIVRFDTKEGSYGITTILLLFITLFTISVSLKVIRYNRVFQAFALLVVWLTIASLSAYDPIQALINSATLFFYLMASMVAYSYFSDNRRVLWLLVAVCLGGFLSGILTIVDYLSIIDIPKINELYYSTHTTVGSIVQASGPFARRSAMGIYYTMIIAASVLMAVLGSYLSRLQRLFFASTAIVCTVALMLTHTRAAVFGAAISTALVVLSQLRSPVRALKYIGVTALIYLFVITIISNWFPEVWLSYQALFGIGTVASADPFLPISDRLRFLFAIHALNSIIYNPLGHGYSLMTDFTFADHFMGGAVDPHNIFSQIIWGAGFFGLIWLLCMGRWGLLNAYKLLMFRQSGNRVYYTSLALLGSLLAFLITNMAHTSISTGLAWLLFGSFMRLYKTIVSESENSHQLLKNSDVL